MGEAEVRSTGGVRETSEEWGVAASGATARAMLRTSDRAIEAPQNFRVSVDGARCDFMRVRRVWSTGCIERGRAHDSASLRFVCPNDGRAVLQVGGRSRELPPGSLAMLPGSADYRLAYLAPSSRLEVEFEEGLGVSSAKADALLMAPGSSALIAPLTAFVAAIIDDRTGPSAPQWPYLCSAIRALARGLAQQAPGLLPSGASDRFEEALRIIQREAHDSGFTVAQLAEELYTSPRTLHRVFSRRGTTAAAELTRIRVEKARALLAARPHDAESRRAAAALAGFSSVRTMRDALRRAQQNGE